MTTTLAPSPAASPARPTLRCVCAAGAIGLLAALGLGVGAPPTAAAGLDVYESDVRVDRTVRDERITESSGLARSRVHSGLLWTHNDRGDSARVFGVARDGTTSSVLTLDGVQAVDFEALAWGRDPQGRSALYVGDIGDNSRSRDEIAVHRVPEPEELRDSEVTPVTFRFQYPGAAAHDAETLLVDPRSQQIYIVTKSDSVGAVYAAPPSPDPEQVEELVYVGPAPVGVTDGAMQWSGAVVLRGYTSVTVMHGVKALEDSVTSDLPKQRQGESLTMAFGGTTMLIGSEGPTSQVLRVPLPDGSQ